MNITTSKLGEWIDKLANLKTLPPSEKVNFVNELIKYFEDPSREEYEKCKSLLEALILLNQQQQGRMLDVNKAIKIAEEVTQLILVLINSIQNEINSRINNLKNDIINHGK